MYATKPDGSIHGESIDEQTRAIQAAYRRLGRPPTARQTAEHSARGHDWFHPDGEDWDDVLRAAGVPGYDDVVARELRDAFEDRYPWQEFVVVRASDFADDTKLGASHIGQKIGQIADGIRSPDAAACLDVSRCQTGNGHMKWKVGPAEVSGE